MLSLKACITESMYYRKFFRYIFSFCCALCFSVVSMAQFTNGTHMTFGKNRVQHKERLWRYLRYQDFDVYYDKDGKELANFVALHAIPTAQELYETLQLQCSYRIIYIVYSTPN
ncbi:MAG: hypothetical protein LBR55_05250, partial [Bacteroidales bacterium]|nr:hypothetical protein [Bacteroidales bacterium]